MLVQATALGYEIIGTEYPEKPVGFSTVIGIQTGYWANGGNLWCSKWNL